MNAGRMAARALEFQPGCYRLWQLAGSLAQDPEGLSLLLMRGIIAWAPRGLVFSAEQGDLAQLSPPPPPAGRPTSSSFFFTCMSIKATQDALTCLT